ncbi:MAG: hypothetical protein QMB63_07865 [Clostridiaceae bacterium]
MIVKVKYANRNEFSPDRNPLELTGEFRGVDNEILVISTESGLRCINATDILTMEEVQTKKSEYGHGKNITDISVGESNDTPLQVFGQAMTKGPEIDGEQTTEFKPIVTEDKEVATLKNSEAPQVQAEEQGTYNIISGKHLIKVKVISVENAPINPKYPFYVISGNTLYAHEFGKTTFLPVQEALQKYIRQISHL